MIDYIQTNTSVVNLTIKVNEQVLSTYYNKKDIFRW